VIATFGTPRCVPRLPHICRVGCHPNGTTKSHPSPPINVLNQVLRVYPAVRDPQHPPHRTRQLTERQKQRLEDAFTEREEHLEVDVAWQCAQQLRDAYQHPDLTGGRQIAERVVDTFHTCPIPEIARLGRTLRQWREPFLSYWDTDRSSNGGTAPLRSSGAGSTFAPC
jgi:hypothetical protein